MRIRVPAITADAQGMVYLNLGGAGGSAGKLLARLKMLAEAVAYATPLATYTLNPKIMAFIPEEYRGIAAAAYSVGAMLFARVRRNERDRQARPALPAEQSPRA